MLVETPLTFQHQAAGAALGEWFGCRLPAAFSGFSTEYRAAREGVALLDTNYRAWFRLEGPDRVRYLNAMLTNETKDLAPGQGTRALLLNPQGHILSELEILSLEKEYLLSCPMPARERTFETLDKYIIMDDALLTEVTGDTASVGFEGPGALPALSTLLGLSLEQLPAFGHTSAEFRGMALRLVRNGETGLPGVRIIAPSRNLEALWAALAAAARAVGGMPVGWEALNALRLESGIPWLGYDFDEGTIPHEAALETTHISFSKGCYMGQEIVERVRSRGHVNRRRAGLAFSGTEVPVSGTVLTHSGEGAGHVTSAAFSPRLGRPIGMGYVRRAFLASGARFHWPGGTAELIELPLASAGGAGKDSEEPESGGSN
jgi:folate-binding protein YgfZ